MDTIVAPAVVVADRVWVTVTIRSGACFVTKRAEMPSFARVAIWDLPVLTARCTAWRLPSC